jgi:hypothetical protein
MAVVSVSQSQLCELLGFEGCVTKCTRTSTGWDLTVEDTMQTSGTFPELTRKPTKKGGKKR